MLNIKEKLLLFRENRWLKNRDLFERELLLKQDKSNIKHKYKKTKVLTSKALIAFLFINCVIIELYACYITQLEFMLALMLGTSPNLSPIIAVIGSVVGEVIGYAIYSIKATKENTKGGITYDMAMYEKNNLSKNLYSDDEDEDYTNQKPLV